MKHYVGNKVCDSSNQWLELFLKLSMLHSWCWALCCHGTSSLEALFSLPLEVEISVPHVNTQVDIHLCYAVLLMVSYDSIFSIYKLATVFNYRAVFCMNVAMDTLITLYKKAFTIMCLVVHSLWFFLNVTILHFLCWVLCWRRNLQSWTAAYLLNGRKGANITTKRKADSNTLFQFSFNLMERQDKFLHHLPNSIKQQKRNLSFPIFKISPTVHI